MLFNPALGGTLSPYAHLSPHKMVKFYRLILLCSLGLWMIPLPGTLALAYSLSIGPSGFNMDVNHSRKTWPTHMLPPNSYWNTNSFTHLVLSVWLLALSRLCAGRNESCSTGNSDRASIKRQREEQQSHLPALWLHEYVFLVLWYHPLLTHIENVTP